MVARLVWIDMEMSGLDVVNDVILEIATIVTDENLNVVAETPNMVIHHSAETLERMNDWSREHHTESGLVDEVLGSEISLVEAEAVTLDMVSRHVEEHKAPLCGNTIWQDRRFLMKYMPTLEAYFHYRIIDVSSIKELARMWRPDVLNAAKEKAKNHRALDDIRESIDELAYYQSSFFK